MNSTIRLVNACPDFQDQESSDIYWMRQALLYAKNAEELDEIPIGCIIVHEQKLLSFGFNERETTFDPTSHAEIIAIRRAATALERWRLLDCTLYVTVEPCCMCAGAIILARIPRVVFGTKDPKAGAAGSIFNLLNDSRLNHRPQVVSGILEKECQDILRTFFQKKRNNVRK